MTLKEAKMTIYANVVYACEKAELSPMTIKMVKDACDTVIELAEQANTPRADCLTCGYNSDEWDSPKCDSCSKAHSNYEPQNGRSE